MRMNLGAAEALAVASQLGFMLAACVVVGILGGSWLDARLGLEYPVFLILGSILGTVAGIYTSWRTAKYLLEKFGRKKNSDLE